ncbi:MAG: hypothetical protein ACKOGL_11220, partial [Acidimicrobiaceae bacterium]
QLRKYFSRIYRRTSRLKNLWRKIRRRLFKCFFVDYLDVARIAAPVVHFLHHGFARKKIVVAAIFSGSAT